MPHPDDEIMKTLHWLYKERTLCNWCQHPKHKPKTRGLWSHCYGLAKEFWKKPTAPLAIAVSIRAPRGSTGHRESRCERLGP